MSVIHNFVPLKIWYTYKQGRIYIYLIIYSRFNKNLYYIEIPFRVFRFSTSSSRSTTFICIMLLAPDVNLDRDAFIFKQFLDCRITSDFACFYQCLSSFWPHGALIIHNTCLTNETDTHFQRAKFGRLYSPKLT